MLSGVFYVALLVYSLARVIMSDLNVGPFSLNLQILKLVDVQRNLKLSYFGNY